MESGTGLNDGRPRTESRWTIPSPMRIIGVIGRSSSASGRRWWSIPAVSCTEWHAPVVGISPGRSGLASRSDGAWVADSNSSIRRSRRLFVSGDPARPGCPVGPEASARSRTAAGNSWRELTAMSEETLQTIKGHRSLRAGPTAMALVIGLAALTAHATESDLVRDIQRYCTVCWRNAHLDPGLWDDCTQEVCCRLLSKARAGELELNLVLADDTPERRELVRAIDMVRKRVQRTKRHPPLDEQHAPSLDLDRRQRNRQELGEI